MHALRTLSSSNEPLHCGNQQRGGVLILPRVLLNPGLLVSFPQHLASDMDRAGWDQHILQPTWLLTFL